MLIFAWHTYVINVLLNDAYIIISTGVMEFPVLDTKRLLAKRRDMKLSRHAKITMKYWSTPSPPPVVMLPWIPKNPDVRVSCTEDRTMSEAEWAEANFPFNDIPVSVTTHVNLEVWQCQADAISHMPDMMAQSGLMNKVMDNLANGCDSEVGAPGDGPSACSNSFLEPAVDIPRMADALAQEIKMKNMAGPFNPGQIPRAKISGFLSIAKSDGARRQVGNMSASQGD